MGLSGSPHLQWPGHTGNAVPHYPTLDVVISTRVHIYSVLLSLSPFPLWWVEVKWYFGLSTFYLSSQPSLRFQISSRNMGSGAWRPCCHVQYPIRESGECGRATVVCLCARSLLQTKGLKKPRWTFQENDNHASMAACHSCFKRKQKWFAECSWQKALKRKNSFSLTIEIMMICKHFRYRVFFDNNRLVLNSLSFRYKESNKHCTHSSSLFIIISVRLGLTGKRWLFIRE